MAYFAEFWGAKFKLFFFIVSSVGGVRVNSVATSFIIEQSNE